MRRLRPVGILGAGCAAAAAVAVLVLHPGPAAPSTSATVVRAGSPKAAGTSGPSIPAIPATPSAAQVLREWDARRQAAWRAGDADALRDLYRPGSEAGRADAALLERWLAAGWQVTALHTQVFAVDVVEGSPTSLTVRVTDRLAGGQARRDDVRRTLPASTVRTRTLTFVLGPDGRWRVAASA